MINKIANRCLKIINEINRGTYQDNANYNYLKEVFEEEIRMNLNTAKNARESRVKNLQKINSN